MFSLLYKCLFLLVLFLSLSFAQDDGYESFASMPGSRYKLYTIKKNWIDAVSTCQDDGDGSHLLIINSNAEAAVAIALFDRITDLIQQFMYVGISDILEENRWVTIQGDLINATGYDNWKPGQPGNEYGNEDCLFMTRDGFYADEVCCNPRAFICEKPVA